MRNKDLKTVGSRDLKEQFRYFRPDQKGNIKDLITFVEALGDQIFVMSDKVDDREDWSCFAMGATSVLRILTKNVKEQLATSEADYEKLEKMIDEVSKNAAARMAESA